MASSSSPSPQILCASFNQDNSLFYTGTKDGFKIFDARTGRLCYEKSLGGISNMEMYFGTSLLAIVGTGEQTALSPRRLCLFNTKTGATKKDLNFKTSVLAVQLSEQRYGILYDPIRDCITKALISDDIKISFLAGLDSKEPTKYLLRWKTKK
ncbi:hypothetical protein GUJ93_ZPchr0006g41432 [Zizania palustris]|uniref:Uncharacterized protein n=1 Tax=Zizania palustris TaxID=103762 RepID=A0A8J5SW95_ZIZPA|nr:hypothetical protein GUJ93_ZPchr0006g41432 [Zizania palustris]